MNIRKNIGICSALIILIITALMPVPYGLTLEGKNTIGITLFFLVLLVTEAIPLAVSSLLTIGLIPIFNVSERFEGAVLGFAHPVIFFIIASFGIAGAIMNTPITRRILFALLKKAGGRIETVLLAMMITTAVTSFFISNIPTCAIMMSIALEFINSIEDSDAKRSIGKSFMIAIPVATMIGGIATPASSSLNLLAIGLLEQNAGVTITFVQWMAIGIPLVIVFIPFAWFLMIKVYKPAQINLKKLKLYMDIIRVNERVGKKEAFVISIMVIMLILWILSSWVRGIEIFTVTLIGCVIFLLPGINILAWDKFLDDINWNIIFISGTTLSLAHALVANDVSNWMVNNLYPANLLLSTNILVGFAAVITFIMLLIITSAPALITVLAGPFASIALANGISSAYLIIVLAFCACNCYLFPLDTVQLLTYSKGYYRMTDMCKSTIFLQIALIIILAFWIPFMGGIMNLK